MSIKGDSSRAKILKSARKLFAKNGYSKVTMQDICRACDISRGGLYRHYSSTEEIFIAIIEKDESDALEYLSQAVLDKIPGAIMFKAFLQLRTNILLNPEECIENAISEFAKNSETGKKLLVERANNSIQILTEMIELGCVDGSFSCNDPRRASKMILWTLEGMGKHNELIPLNPDEAQEYISLILALISQ